MAEQLQRNFAALSVSRDRYFVQIAVTQISRDIINPSWMQWMPSRLEFWFLIQPLPNVSPAHPLLNFPVF